MNDVDHQPNRLFYDCLACGQTWPCAPARRHLAATAPSRGYLAMWMAAELGLATSVLAHESPAALFDRFLNWTRPQATS